MRRRSAATGKISSTMAIAAIKKASAESRITIVHADITEESTIKDRDIDSENCLFIRAFEQNDSVRSFELKDKTLDMFLVSGKYSSHTIDDAAGCGTNLFPRISLTKSSDHQATYYYLYQHICPMLHGL